MWILESTAHSEKRTHSILGDHKYVVGRQNCDIVVSDPSVSRRQAVLTMAHYETNVAKSFIIPTLTLEDVSKFGTFVNGKAVKTAGGNTVTLKENDQIKFGGTPASVYSAKYRPFLATTSCLEKGPKKALQRVMCLLGGHLVRDWRPTCDLLIMSKINVTLKVICAINNQKHIVTPKYLDDLHQHLMGRADKPDPTQYLPEVVDQEVPPGVSFHPDKRRQTLLDGLKFYFLSPLQFNKTNLAVSTAGGQPILLEDGSDEDAEAMTQEGTVVVLVTKDVMDTLSPASAKFVRTVMSTLKRKNLRMITDPEIGTAILTCNMVDYCNPRTALAANLQAAMASQMMSQMTDVDGTQASCPVRAAVAARDVKPEIRPSPAMAAASPAEWPRKTGPDEPAYQQLIKPEKISQSGRGGPAAVAPHANLPRPLPETANTTLASFPVTPPALATPAPEAASLDNASGGTFKPPSRGSVQHKEGGGAKSDGVPLSQLSGDLFGDASTADESPAKPGVREGARQSVPTLPVLANEKLSDALSVFAQQRNKNSSTSGRTERKHNERKSKSLFADEEEEICVKKDVSKRRKTSSLFDSDDEEDCKRQISGLKKRRDLFDDDSEEDISNTSLLQKRCKNSDKSLILRGREEAVKDHDTERCSELPQISSSSKSEASVSERTTNVRGMEKIQHLPVASKSPARVGWVNVSAKKARSRSKAESEGDEDDDVKPDVELLRDPHGKVLRNVCEVELTNLVVRQPGKRSNLCQDPNSITGGQKNFKRFKKTEHAGAGKLPTVIGGRDLEEHTGTAHRDLEDLFAKGVARQNEREEEERQNRDLFDWDTKGRKASNRKTR